MSKCTYDHDCYYLKKFDEYIFDNAYTTKIITEDMTTGWIKTLTGKSSSIANEVIVIRIFLRNLNNSGTSAYIPPVPKVSDDYVPYIFSDMELKNIFTLSDNIQMTKAQTNPYIQVEYPLVIRLMYGCGLRIEYYWGSKKIFCDIL